MKESITKFPIHSVICLACVLALIGMGAYSIYCRPKGEIAISVIKYCWCLTTVIAIFQIRPIIREAQHFHFEKGDLSVDIDKHPDAHAQN